MMTKYVTIVVVENEKRLECLLKRIESLKIEVDLEKISLGIVFKEIEAVVVSSQRGSKKPIASWHHAYDSYMLDNCSYS